MSLTHPVASLQDFPSSKRRVDSLYRFSLPNPHLYPSSFGNSLWRSPASHGSGSRAIDQLSNENVELDFRLGREAQERTLLQSENQRLLSSAISERNRSCDLLENQEFLYRNEMALKTDLKLRLKESTEEIRRKNSDISDLRSTIEEISQKNKAITKENSRLKMENEAKENVIFNLEKKITRLLGDLERHQREYLTSHENAREEVDNSVALIRQNYERKIEMLEQQKREIALVNEKLERETQELKSAIERNASQHIEETKMVQKAILEEQERRYLQPIRNLEAKIRALENEKNEAYRRLSGVSEEARLKDSQLRDANNWFPHELDRLRMENEQLRRSLKESFGIADNLEVHARSKSLVLNEVNAKLEHSELVSQHSSKVFQHDLDLLRSQNERNLQLFEQKERELVEMNRSLKELLGEAEKEIVYLREEYKRLVVMLRANLNNTISSTLLDHVNGTFEAVRLA